MNILEEERQRVQEGAKRRVQEVKALLEMLEPNMEIFTSKEQGFMSDMYDRLEQYGDKTFVSERQLFWLRDLKDRI